MIDLQASKKLGKSIISPAISDSGIICIYGKNGSGKTSTLLMICGFILPDSGYIRINGRDVTTLPPQKRSAVYINQESFFPDLDVDEHLVRFSGDRKPNAAEIEHVKDITGISFNGKVRDLSMGQRIRVTLGTALIRKPQVIAVDEAFSNLDNKEKTISIIVEYARSNSIDLIFVTQDQDDSKLSDHLYRMDSGISERLF